MTDVASSLAGRAAVLRAAFDAAFAVAADADPVVRHDLLAFRVGPDPFAVHLAEVGGLFVDRKIVRAPGSNAALLGIAGFRGALVPVYSLQALLGGSGTSAPRWLFVAAAAPVALAFDAFEAHLRVRAEAILPRQSKAETSGFAPEFVRAADITRPIIHLASVIAALDAMRSPPQRQRKESEKQ